jgi:hypothetical protein
MLSNIKKNLKGMLADHEDSECLSSKRVVAFLAFICCVVAFFVDLFTDYTVTASMFDAMMWIVVGGLGFTGLEKFAPKE